MKLYKVTISAGGNEKFRTKSFEIECTETPKAYKWTGNLIVKSKLMLIDNMMRNEGCGWLHYHIYCLEPQIEEAKAKLYTQCIYKLKGFTEQLENLKKSLTE